MPTLPSHLCVPIPYSQILKGGNFRKPLAREAALVMRRVGGSSLLPMTTSKINTKKANLMLMKVTKSIYEKFNHQ